MCWPVKATHLQTLIFQHSCNIVYKTFFQCKIGQFIKYIKKNQLVTLYIYHLFYNHICIGNRHIQLLSTTNHYRATMLDHLHWFVMLWEGAAVVLFNPTKTACLVHVNILVPLNRLLFPSSKNRQNISICNMFYKCGDRYNTECCISYHSNKNYWEG